MCPLGDGDDRQTSVEWWCQIIGIGVVSEHVDGIAAAVLTHRGVVVHCVRCIVDVVDRDIDRRGVGVPGIARAVITDGVGEAVTAEVVRRGSVAHA